MKILQMRVSAFCTNCYLLFDETSREGAIIDPGDNAEGILQVVQEEKLSIRYILLTHAHSDHVMAAAQIQQATGAQTVLHEADRGLLKEEIMREYHPFMKHYQEPEIQTFATEGTAVTFGGMTATYLHTPGHTPGSCVIRVNNYLFTGDTLFRHECGRCDLPGGDFDQMLQSLKRLYRLEGDYQVLPGHDAFSTLEEERQQNPYMRQALAQ